MATKSYTDLEQSKKLAEILSPESADMCYLPTHIGDEHHFIASLSPYSMCTKMTDVSIEYCTPCWSLAALLEQLPYEVCDDDGNSFYLQIYKENDCYQLAYTDPYEDFESMETHRYEHFVDACYELILKLHELNLL